MSLLLAALVGGAVATWLFDDDARPVERLAMGVPVGLAWLGLSGFAVASLLGIGPPALALAALLAVAPAVVVAASPSHRRQALSDLRDWRQRLRNTARPAPAAAALLGSGLVAALAWRVYHRAMFLDEGAIYTGVDHNVGDLPFHLAIVASFVYGANFPPEHPELAGARLSYPFLVDFVSALLVAGGSSLRAALFSVNLLLVLALVALLARWGGRLSGDRMAGLLTPALVLLSGGLGFWLLVAEARQAPGGLSEALRGLTHDYTILSSGELRWGNAVVTLFVPQRSFLFGLPLFLVMSTLWWDALAGAAAVDARRAAGRMTGAGVVGGLLPLVHAHSFALALAMGSVLAALFPRRAVWTRFFLPAAGLGLPQLAWAGAGSSVKPAAFLGWQPGWDRGEQDPIWFWLYNTGLFIPALCAALAFVAVRRWGPPRLLRFYLPFTLCFLVPNLLRLSPWIWDNIKFLFYWWVASAALVALLLARLLRSGPAGAAFGLVLLLGLVLAGALDVARVAAGLIRIPLFTQQAVAFAARVRETTPPRALLLNAPTYNSPVLLTGRRSLLGYPGHIWSQGLDAGEREGEIGRIYSGEADAEALLVRHRVDFIVVGPQERQAFAVNDAFLGRFPALAEAGAYRLLAARPAVVPLRGPEP